MTNCQQIWINQDLYKNLSDIANPCDKHWIKSLEPLTAGTVGQIYKAVLDVPVEGLRDHYIIKEQPIGFRSTLEKQILNFISADMLEDRAPLLFPFLYLNYVCANKAYMVLQPADYSIAETLYKPTVKKNVNWWVEILYQLSKAIYYLESQQINHNDLTFDNIMVQYASTDLSDIALMLIDFGSAVRGPKKHSNLPAFTLGRDLNYFFYMLIFDGVPKGYFPKILADQIYPFIKWENYPKQAHEDEYLYGLRRTNITTFNYRTSGKFISRWLQGNYPFVAVKCNLERLNRIYGTAVGAIVGDAFGMPLEFDETRKRDLVTEMRASADFNGLLASWELPAGTFTDDTQMALALVDSILLTGKFTPSNAAAHFRSWFDSDPIDIGTHTKAVLSKMAADGSNWYSVSKKAYKANPTSAANGATMRTWPISIYHHARSDAHVIKDSLLQSQTTHMNNDAIYAAVFVNCLIHKLINGQPLEKSLSECIALIRPYISQQLIQAIDKARETPYKKLDGGTGWIVNTMSVVIWSIVNTNNFRDAIITAANIKGDADTNASITGAIAGALYGLDAIPPSWIKALDHDNEYNIWGNQQMKTAIIKDMIASLANC